VIFMKPLPFLLALLLLAVPAFGELTEAERELIRQLGPGTPEPIPLWPDKPPRFLENAAPEVIVENQTIQSVSIPTITPYLPPEDHRNGMALVVCAGGGYGGHAWKTHVIYAAQVFNPMGVAVIGLKYRTRPPHLLKHEGIQALTLLDAKRALRLVKHRAAEWGLDPEKIGVAGYSAGANLAMNLAANFDAGDPDAADPVERLSSRPAFAVGLGTWHWRKPENPFVFRKDSPPVYLVHATTDTPVEIAENIVADLKALGVPARLDLFEEGGHGVGNLIPQRVKAGFPPAKWPQLLIEWLAEDPAGQATDGGAKPSR
jgi:endo-1,4-beta-xylanase